MHHTNIGQLGELVYQSALNAIRVFIVVIKCNQPWRNYFLFIYRLDSVFFYSRQSQSFQAQYLWMKIIRMFSPTFGCNSLSLRRMTIRYCFSIEKKKEKETCPLGTMSPQLGLCYRSTTSLHMLTKHLYKFESN